MTTDSAGLLSPCTWDIDSNDFWFILESNSDDFGIISESVLAHLCPLMPDTRFFKTVPTCMRELNFEGPEPCVYTCVVGLMLLLLGLWECGGRASHREARTGGGGGPGEIIGGPTAPPGLFPEIEVEKGRSSSEEGKHSMKAVKENSLNRVIRMTFATDI